MYNLGLIVTFIPKTCFNSNDIFTNRNNYREMKKKSYLAKYNRASHKTVNSYF